MRNKLIAHLPFIAALAATTKFASIFRGGSGSTQRSTNPRYGAIPCTNGNSCGFLSIGSGEVHSRPSFTAYYVVSTLSPAAAAASHDSRQGRQGFVSIAPPATGTKSITFHSTSTACKTCLSTRPAANTSLSFKKWRVYLLRWRDAVVRFIRQHSFASGVVSIFSSCSGNGFADATQPVGNYFTSNTPVFLSSVKTQDNSSCSHAQSQLHQH